VVAPVVGPAMTHKREELLFDLCMALRQVPPGILRDLGRRRLPDDELAERIAAEAILEHLIRCGWRLERSPAPGTNPTR
jgi:hypothetical protein